MNLRDRKIQRFRCTVDPMIPPRPRNAFDNGPKGDCRGWEFELTPAGVYVKCILTIPGQAKAETQEHLVPFGNIQSIKFLPEEPEADTTTRPNPTEPPKPAGK